MRKIYIVNYGPHMSEALEKLKKDYNYDLIILTEGNVNIFSTDRLSYDIENKIKETNPSDKDYLLLGGNNVINTIAALIFYENVGKVNFLIYDAKNKEYVKRENVRINGKRL